MNHDTMSANCVKQFGCQRPECRTRFLRYRKRYNIDRARGRVHMIDATEARQHIHALQARGWSQNGIAEAAGLHQTPVWKIAHGQKVARRETVNKILAIPLDALADRLIPRKGNDRRLQALLFMGWPHHELTRRSGLQTKVLLAQGGTHVSRKTYEKVCALFDELAMIPGPSSRTASRARKAGYVGPLAWDDIDRDAKPDTGAKRVGDAYDHAVVERALASGERPARRFTHDEAAEVAKHALARGMTHQEIRDIYGIKADRYVEVPASRERHTDPEREAS